MAKFLPLNDQTQLQTGDVLKVDSFVPLVDHFAIVFQKDGVYHIAENKYVTGELGTELLSDYRKRRTITGYLRTAETSALTNQFIESKFQECVSTGYKFFEFNCEDFVRHICNCDVGYDQRRRWAFIFAGIITAFLLLYIFTTSNR